MLVLEKLALAGTGFRLTADWSVQPGEKIAVIGPSGGGKSSLLMAISGFFAPSGGRILWAGRDLQPLAPAQRPVSILFQDQNLFPHLTISQNMMLGLTAGRHPSASNRDLVAATLFRFGLGDLGERKPAQLSGGQQGRAALARALLRQRPLLLLDEPFAALGPALKAEMQALVCEVADEQGAALLMVTHDPADALRLGGRTILVAGGLARAPVATAELFADPPPELRAYLGVNNKEFNEDRPFWRAGAKPAVP